MHFSSGPPPPSLSASITRNCRYSVRKYVVIYIYIFMLYAIQCLCRLFLFLPFLSSSVFSISGTPCSISSLNLKLVRCRWDAVAATATDIYIFFFFVFFLFISFLQYLACIISCTHSYFSFLNSEFVYNLNSVKRRD